MSDETNNSERWALSSLHYEAAMSTAAELAALPMPHSLGGMEKVAAIAEVVAKSLRRARYWQGKTTGPNPETVEP